METAVLDNKTIELDKDGNLAHREDWNENIAQEFATMEGVGELNERHWIVINFMRNRI